MKGTKYSYSTQDVEYILDCDSRANRAVMELRCARSWSKHAAAHSRLLYAVIDALDRQGIDASVDAYIGSVLDRRIRAILEE